MTISFAAGQLITSNQMNLLAPLLTSKAVNQSVTNSATLVNDNDIVFTFVANQTVMVECYLGVFATTNVPGIGVAWGATGTITGVSRSGLGSPKPPNTTVFTTTMQTFLSPGSNLTATFNIGADTNSSFPTMYQDRLLLTTGASGGTLQLKWAQATATAATTTTVAAGSYAIARYVA